MRLRRQHRRRSSHGIPHASELVVPSQDSYALLTGAKLAAVNPAGTVEKLTNATHLNSLRSWYEGFRGKDANADRVYHRILHGARIEYLRFDPDGDMKERWTELGF